MATDAWNLSGRCQATQDAQGAGDAEDTTQDTRDARDATQDARDAGDATQDAQDAGDADSTSRASGRNGAVSDAGQFFADVEMHCRNSYPIDGVECTRVGPTHPPG